MMKDTSGVNYLVGITPFQGYGLIPFSHGALPRALDDALSGLGTLKIL